MHSINYHKIVSLAPLFILLLLIHTQLLVSRQSQQMALMPSMALSLARASFLVSASPLSCRSRAHAYLFCCLTVLHIECMSLSIFCFYYAYVYPSPPSSLLPYVLQMSSSSSPVRQFHAHQLCGFLSTYASTVSVSCRMYLALVCVGRSRMRLNLYDQHEQQSFHRVSYAMPLSPTLSLLVLVLVVLPLP